MLELIKLIHSNRCETKNLKVPDIGLDQVRGMDLNLSWLNLHFQLNPRFSAPASKYKEGQHIFTKYNDGMTLFQPVLEKKILTLLHT